MIVEIKYILYAYEIVSCLKNVLSDENLKNVLIIALKIKCN